MPRPHQLDNALSAANPIASRTLASSELSLEAPIREWCDVRG